jgi:hypothetical protein
LRSLQQLRQLCDTKDKAPALGSNRDHPAKEKKLSGGGNACKRRFVPFPHGLRVDFGGCPESWQGRSRRSGMEDQSMTAYVLVIMLAAGGHHQSFAVGYPDQGSCLVAAERLRRSKKAHVECLKFVQGK